MLFATAESPRTKRGAKTAGSGDRSPRKAKKVHKARSKTTHAVTATLLEVVERLDEAFDKVEANDGAAGLDRQTVHQVRLHWNRLRSELADSLQLGRYRPGEIRRVWIPKPGGGQRGLGIPNVVDRVVQQALLQVLEPLFEPTFHDSSHGFRPRRGARTAMAEARKHLAEGFAWTVDVDLSKFFDHSS
jgi:retron-type reverse transcriptase